MLSFLNQDIRYNIFEFLTGKDLIILDTSLCKGKREILEMYKYLQNIQLDNPCTRYLDYFNRNNLKIYRINFSNLENLHTLSNIEIDILSININFDKYLGDDFNVSLHYNRYELLTDYMSNVNKIKNTKIGKLNIILSISNESVFHGLNMAMACTKNVVCANVINNGVKIGKIENFIFSLSCEVIDLELLNVFPNLYNNINIIDKLIVIRYV